MFAVQLGETSQVGGGGVVVTPQASTSLFPESSVPTLPQPVTAGAMPTPSAPTQPVLPASGSTQSVQPVIRRSLGAKSGVNLLGDLEKWALPDAQKVAQASLTFSGLSVKEVRDLCIKLPPKLQAELQLTLPPEGGPTT